MQEVTVTVLKESHHVLTRKRKNVKYQDWQNKLWMNKILTKKTMRINTYMLQMITTRSQATPRLRQTKFGGLVFSYGSASILYNLVEALTYTKKGLIYSTKVRDHLRLFDPIVTYLKFYSLNVALWKKNVLNCHHLSFCAIF